MLNVSHGTIANHAKKWAKSVDHDLLAAAGAHYKAAWAAACPGLCAGEPVATALPLVVDALFEEWLPTTAKMQKLNASGLQGLMRTQMMQYRNRKLIDGFKCAWDDSYAATRAAFAARGFASVTVCVEHVSKLAKTGLPGNRNLGRATAVPIVLEEELAWVIGKIRSKCGSVDKGIIMAQMDNALHGLNDANPYPDGVTESWYDRFLVRHGLESFNEVPLDINRLTYLQSTNLFKAYKSLYEVAIKFGICDPNHAYISPEETPSIPAIIWRKDEMWRILEFDEAAFDLGIKTKETPHTSGEKQVRRQGSANDLVVRDGVPALHLSAMKCINFAGDNQVDAFVTASGEGADIGKHGLCDDDGTPFTTAVTDGKGGTHQREVFFDTNDKGSFDSEMLVKYLDRLVLEHTLIGRRFTKEKPGILFIDGCQTHLAKRVLDWCDANNFHIVIKLPYGSSLMQTMDCHGGHFSVVKPRYRKQLRIRCFQLMIAHSNATALQRAAGVGQGGKLMLKDFVPMIKAAWNSICEPERHKMCLKTCGYVPFTMAPAFKMLAEEKAREVEGQGVERTQWTNADLCTSVDKLHSGVIQHLTYAGGAPKGTINKAKALVAAAAGTPAATGATATAAAAVAPMTVEAMRAAMAAAAAELDFETAAALRDRIKAANAVAALALAAPTLAAPALAAPATPVMAVPVDAVPVDDAGAEIAAIVEVGHKYDAVATGLAAYAAGTFTKEDDAGDAAAKAVIANFPHLDGDDRAVLTRLSVQQGWNVMRSGHVFTHFHAHPTGTRAAAWSAALEARKAAAAAFKGDKGVVRAANQQAAAVTEEALSDAAVVELTTNGWGAEYINKMKVPDLRAVLRCKFKQAATIKKSGKAALTRPELVEKLLAFAEKKQLAAAQRAQVDDDHDRKRMRVGDDDDE